MERNKLNENITPMDTHNSKVYGPPVPEMVRKTKTNRIELYEDNKAEVIEIRNDDSFAFVKAVSTNQPIFGFAEFISALALLVIVYTITDVRYKFRINVSWFPVKKFTFASMIFIGLGSLVADFYFSQSFLIPKMLNQHSLLQSLFGLLFLFTISTWIFIAFISPPLFGKRNYKKYAQVIFNYILKGNNRDLAIVADELRFSIANILNAADRDIANSKNAKDDIRQYAHDILLLLGNRKLCREIILRSPGTAIEVFKGIEKCKYKQPIGQFAKNITSEAILNEDSIIYQEGDGYYSGFLGYLKPFTSTIYGNYELVESLGKDNNSPLDFHYIIDRELNAKKYRKYTELVLIFCENYIKVSKERGYINHSFVFTRCTNNIAEKGIDLYKIDDSEDYYNSDVYQRFDASVHFFKELINYIEEYKPVYFKLTNRCSIKKKDTRNREDILDFIVQDIEKIIFHSTYIRTKKFMHWSIQHNLVFTSFFRDFEKNEISKIILYRLRRNLYEEIKSMDEFINYKSAAILAYCLNIFGLTIGKKSDLNIDSYALHKVILTWTKKNYMKIREELPDVADHCLMGNISYDDENKRLVQTIEGFLSKEPRKYYLELDEAKSKKTK